MDKTRGAVLDTITYSDFFEYPLKSPELKKFLISPFPVSGTELEESLKELCNKSLVEELDGFFFLPERKGFVRERLNREFISNEKLKRVKKFIGYLSYLPFVKLVGLTGDLSYGNARPRSDVDLMVVTSVGRMWLSRLLTFSLLEILGLKMKEKKNDVRTKVCINVWCDENNLEIPENERDLVLASDIIHIVPLINRENTYEKLISSNLWLKNYFPNWNR